MVTWGVDKGSNVVTHHSQFPSFILKRSLIHASGYFSSFLVCISLTFLAKGNGWKLRQEIHFS